MQISVSAAWAKYNDENKSKKVSLGKFASLRPRNIRKLSTQRVLCMRVLHQYTIQAAYSRKRSPRFDEEAENK